ncbi:DUF2274 domain-containing protein [Sphingomonas sp. 1P08PE]|uniref:DUF2274 domain-containing protein n=1 Tax=Sphingomonas sp. 1P08PE TaxID=554122 RepID=UPI0039A3931D
MPDIKLPRLPDRTPVKLTLSILPELQARLDAYARVYTATYGTSEPVTELVPAMLTSFLDGDREFARMNRGGAAPQG